MVMIEASGQYLDVFSIDFCPPQCSQTASNVLAPFPIASVANTAVFQTLPVYYKFKLKGQRNI